MLDLILIPVAICIALGMFLLTPVILLVGLAVTLLASVAEIVLVGVATVVGCVSMLASSAYNAVRSWFRGQQLEAPVCQPVMQN